MEKNSELGSKIIDKRPFTGETLTALIDRCNHNIKLLKDGLESPKITAEFRQYTGNLLLDEEIRLEIYERILTDYY